MKITKDELAHLDKHYRIKLINSITGIKPANLIGTKSIDGIDNVAVFSSVVHLGSSPALIGFVMRPQTPEIKDTYQNIKDTNYYTINHISMPFAENAHKTSAKLSSDISEFEVFDIPKMTIGDFYAPFVEPSVVKIGMKLLEFIDLPNGCLLIVGEIVLIEIDERVVNDDGSINLESYDCLGISGLESYYSLTHHKTFTYESSKSDK